ncbi:hypothetical protein [Actinacidiphila sp. bgisy167]|uniref:hypothetical protein n=1 Tax=Actinacidiphila sp. bgisy167 TaxID=3413797 RepID=UPI003D73DC18
MHMNSAPHLLTEDRPEFERALDAALRSEGTRAALADTHSRLSAEQLRTMALNAAAPIAACAAPEYEQFVKLRETAAERRRAARTARVPGLGYAAAAAPVTTDGPGAGLFAIVAVLTPILAATAAVILLLLGYALRLGHPEPAIAPPLRQAGWLFAAVAACGIVIGMVGLLLTALRNGAANRHEPPDDDGSRDVALAREVWRRALLERGLQPFLAEALAQAAGTATTAPAPSATTGGNARMPRLGYSRPDFSSPGPESSPEPGDRFSSPDFSSPDFSSPDFGGPEHRSD